MLLNKIKFGNSEKPSSDLFCPDCARNFTTFLSKTLIDTVSFRFYWKTYWTNKGLFVLMKYNKLDSKNGHYMINCFTVPVFPISVRDIEKE